MKNLTPRINAWMTNYLKYPGDDPETIVQKKIWWTIHVVGTPLLFLFYLDFYEVDYPYFHEMFYVFLSGLILYPVLFHFHRRHIEWWAFCSQITVVLVCSIKVYLYGGMPYAGAPIFIAFLGPIYALVLPNKKRAIFILALYVIGMALATYLHPHPNDKLEVDFFTYGLFSGMIQVFVIIYYFRHQYEKLKNRERERIEELNEAKTKLYTNITHEFRTPITMIMGMAEVVGENNQKGNLQGNHNPAITTDEAVIMINRNGRKLLNLTNQMLDLSKLESKTLPIHLIQDDIIPYLKYLIESFESFARSKDTNLKFNSEPDQLITDFDPDKIQDIVSNLLSNAIKFTPTGGQIEVILKEKGITKFEIIVRDTGIGIPSKQLPYVFDRYYQAEQDEILVKEGTGLGLALTKELVHLLDGDIIVRSPATGLNHGTEFIVSLPVSTQAEVKHPLLQDFPKPEYIETQTKEFDQNGERLSLLIVEDNYDVTNYLIAILENEYDIITARNGKIGLEKALEFVPDLVLSDVMMPVMGGFEFCEKIKQDQRTSHIPVIMLTALADKTSKIEGLESGADAYLAKPFNKEELLVRIRKLITLRRELQRRYRNWTKFGQPLNMKNKEDYFLKKVIKIIEDHMDDESFGVETLCRTLFMSRTQVYRKFKALTNTTAQNFIRDLRLNKAKDILLQTDKNVTEVAMDTGFRNLSHFSKVFTEKFGATPSKVKHS